MGNFWFGFCMGFVVLSVICVVVLCCLIVGARSERGAGEGGSAGKDPTPPHPSLRDTFPSRGRQGCGGECDAVRRDERFAKVCRERDELRKENEGLRQKLTVCMAERELAKTPKNSYEELERMWNNYPSGACGASSPDKGSQVSGI